MTEPVRRSRPVKTRLWDPSTLGSDILMPRHQFVEPVDLVITEGAEGMGRKAFRPTLLSFAVSITIS